MSTRQSKASKAADFKSRKLRHTEADLKGLPENVQVAILDVERVSHDIAERVEFAEQVYDLDPEHPLALEPGNHPQTSWAQRYEVVDGEVLEITKESSDSPVTIVVRDDMFADEDVDPLSALESRLQAPPGNGNE